MILSPINDRIYAHAVESPPRETHENKTRNEDIKNDILLNEQRRKHGKSNLALTLCKKLPFLNDQRPQDTWPRFPKQDEDSLYLIIAYRREQYNSLSMLINVYS
jgi:hypothetical protein